MKRRALSLSLIAVLILLVVFPPSAAAQSYSFTLESQTVDFYVNEDGTVTINYQFVFQNDPFGAPIDYVDVGLPKPVFIETTLTANVDGQPINFISSEDYQGEGNSGVALGLGSNAIQPGERGTVELTVGTIYNMLYTDSDDESYASSNFSPTYFGSEFVNGTTNLTVSFHFPPGVQPEEPKWHSAPSGFPSEPATGIDDQGRVVYTWNNPAARADRRYEFGASFPKQYVPETAISRPTFAESVEETTGMTADDLIGITMCCGIFGFVGLIVVGAYRSTEKRKMQYLPPRLAIEGHGIKRGLTAVEAAILLEQPMDKIMTMILFGVIKKEAAEVIKREPLELKIPNTLPEDLHDYEKDFLTAFRQTVPAKRRRELQDMMVALVRSVGVKMKGFSRRETIAYYQDIMKRAWAQVEAADTPEVKSERFNESLEWTMLDKNYDDRTREVFQQGPVYVPVWWPRYDPTFRPASTGGGPVSTPSSGSGGGGFTTPVLPGSSFAASVVGGAQSFAKGVIGNVTDFTSGVTNKTNPVPVTTSSSGGGRSGGSSGGRSCACACACACAGCACACAGGGR